MIRRSLFAFLLAALCAANVHAVAGPQPPIYTDKSNGGLVPPTFALNAEFLGNSRRGYVELSTPTLQGIRFATTAGIIYGIHNSSGAASDDCLALDTITVPAVTAAGFNTEGVRASPDVLSGGGSATGCTQTANCENWEPVRPGRFFSGLVIIRKGTSKCFVDYRLDSDDVVTAPTR